LERAEKLKDFVSSGGDVNKKKPIKEGGSTKE
jgi:hypothetical protein